MGARRTFDITPQSDADGIATSQTPAAGGLQNLTLDGAFTTAGVASFTDAAHLGVITAVGNETSRVFTFFGTDVRDVTISEAVTGPNATTASTTKYFKTYTDITVDDDTAAAITVGTVGTCSSKWVLVNQGDIVNIGFVGEVSSGATLTWAVESTFADLQDNSDISIVTTDHTDVTAETATTAGNYAFPFSGYRAKVTAFTSGTLKFQTWASY